MSNMKSMEYNYISKRPTQNEQEDINPCEITINIQTSIGVSYNKFLAKMASDIKKPMGITSIFSQDDIENLI